VAVASRSRGACFAIARRLLRDRAALASRSLPDRALSDER
jgi:hypothetical protein